MKGLQRALPLIDCGLCGILLLLVLADKLWPDASLFLNEWVKAYLLVTCLVSAVCGALLIARRRRRARAKRRAAR